MENGNKIGAPIINNANAVELAGTMEAGVACDVASSSIVQEISSTANKLRAYTGKDTFFEPTGRALPFSEEIFARIPRRDGGQYVVTKEAVGVGQI